MLISKIIDVRDNGGSVSVFAQAILNEKCISRNDTTINGEPCQQFVFALAPGDDLNKFSGRILQMVNNEFTQLLADKSNEVLRKDILATLKKTLVGNVSEISTKGVVNVNNIDKL